MTRSIIELKKVSLKTGKKVILKDLNWNVERGEHWVVYGLNGSGKTSILSIVAGFPGNSSGTIQLLGEDVSFDNLLNIRKKIGFVSSSFFDRYYRYENVLDIILSSLNGKLGNSKPIKSEYVREAKRLLNLFGLKNRAQYPYDLLSQGQKQKVLVVRGLIAKPDLLILDEPCSGMDILAKNKFLELITREANLNNTTLIYVSHDTEEFLPIFTHILLLKEGEIFMKGRIKELLTDEIITSFLGCNAIVTRIQERYVITLKSLNGGD